MTQTLKDKQLVPPTRGDVRCRVDDAGKRRPRGGEAIGSIRSLDTRHPTTSGSLGANTLPGRGSIQLIPGRRCRVSPDNPTRPEDRGTATTGNISKDSNMPYTIDTHEVDISGR